MLYVAEAPGKGRGIFTDMALAKDDVIERAPVVVVPAEQVELVEKTVLLDYYFWWKVDTLEIAVAFGYGSLYNHSDEPNAHYWMDYDAKTIVFYALRDIAADEEVSFNYNGNSTEKSALWFSTGEKRPGLWNYGEKQLRELWEKPKE